MTTSALPTFPYNFRMEVSDDFVPLPEAGLDGTAGAEEEWRASLAQLLPSANAEELAAAADALRQALAAMRRENVIRTALCIGHRNEMLAVAVLTVAVQRTRHDSDLVVAEAIFQAKKQELFGEVPEAELIEIDHEKAKGVQGPEDTLLAAQLPCGPAVSSMSMRAMILPQPEGSANEVRLGVATLQLIVPAPANYCLYVTLFTPTLPHMEFFSDHLARIGRTIAFDVEQGREAEATP